MRALWWAGVVVGVVVLALAASPGAEPPAGNPPQGNPPGLKPGQQAVDFRVRMVTGEARSLKLSELRGKYVLLVFIRKDIEACEFDFGTINEGYTRFAGESFTVLAVMSNADRSDVREEMKEHRILFPIGCEEGNEIARAYGIPGVPTAFLIDPQGTIVNWGIQTEPLWQEIARLLGPGETDDEEETGGEPGWLGPATAYYREGELKKAYVLCRRGLVRDPENVRGLVLLGDIYRRADRPKQAIDAYRRALEFIDNEDYGAVSAAYTRIVNVHLAAKDYAKAAAACEQAVATIYETKYAVAFHAYLGLCYGELGKRKKALAAYTKFLKFYKQVDTDVQRRYASLYKSVVARRKALLESGGGSTDTPGPGSSRTNEREDATCHG